MDWRDTAPGPLRERHVLGGYREFVAPAALSEFSEALWIYRTPDRQQGEAAHRVLPELALNLIFCRQRGRPGDYGLHLIGPATRPCVATFPPGCELSSVRVKIEWVTPLLGLRPADHRDQTASLTSVLPGLAGSLLDKLERTDTAEAAMMVLAAELARRANGRLARGALPAAAALDLVRATRGRTSIGRIAERTGFSLRHLRRNVHRQAGISLKGYARTVRYLAAVAAADRSSTPEWARLAADCGFCDQSHLVRESRALSGLSPGQVHRERRVEAEKSNLPAGRAARVQASRQRFEGFDA